MKSILRWATGFLPVLRSLMEGLFILVCTTTFFLSLLLYNEARGKYNWKQLYFPLAESNQTFVWLGFLGFSFLLVLISIGSKFSFIPKPVSWVLGVCLSPIYALFFALYQANFDRLALGVEEVGFFRNFMVLQIRLTRDESVAYIHLLHKSKNYPEKWKFLVDYEQIVSLANGSKRALELNWQQALRESLQSELPIVTSGGNNWLVWTAVGLGALALFVALWSAGNPTPPSNSGEFLATRILESQVSNLSAEVREIANQVSDLTVQLASLSDGEHEALRKIVELKGHHSNLAKFVMEVLTPRAQRAIEGVGAVFERLPDQSFPVLRRLIAQNLRSGG